MATKRLPRRRFLKGLGAVAATATVGEQIALASIVHAASEEKKDREGIFSAVGADADPQILAASQHWGVIWARIIAKAWADWDDQPGHFRHDLIADPKGTIETKLKYKLNPELHLIIAVDPNGTTYKPQNPDPWDGMERNTLTMYLPIPPQ